MSAREQASEPDFGSARWTRIYLRIWDRVDGRLWTYLRKLVLRRDEEVRWICEQVFGDPDWLAEWEAWEAEFDARRPDPRGGDAASEGPPPRAVPEPPPEPPGLWSRTAELLEEGSEREKLAAARVRWLLLRGRAVRETAG